MRLVAGLARRPAGGAYSAAADSLAGLKGREGGKGKKEVGKRGSNGENPSI